MKETFDYTITDPNGLHARPAGLLVRKAQSLTDDITISHNGKSANLKKLLAVMGLGIRNGDTVTVTVEGDHAVTDAADLKKFFSENF